MPTVHKVCSRCLHHASRVTFARVVERNGRVDSMTRRLAFHSGVPRGEAGRLMSRYQIGRDGRTAYELHAGKPFRRQLVDFGERVCCMPIQPGGARQAKLDPKWQDGAFIGIKDRSDEMLIITPSEVYKTRNVRRRQERRERWQQMHIPQTWQSRCQRPHKSFRLWWRQVDGAASRL